MSGHSKWANIKHKKGKMDSIRGKITTKIGREIMVAVRLGGADPTGNMKLKLALKKAKENNVPKDNIQRFFQKGFGALERSNYEEITYEGYGPGGVAIMVEAITDNRNRTASDIRYLFTKYGGNLGETGCVSWMFDRKGIFVIKKTARINEEELMMFVLDAEIEDFITKDNYYEITTYPEDFHKVAEVLDNKGLINSVAKIAMVPKTTVTLSQEDAKQIIQLMDILEDHDDVHEIYSNFDIPEGMMD